MPQPLPPPINNKETEKLSTREELTPFSSLTKACDRRGCRLLQSVVGIRSRSQLFGPVLIEIKEV